MGALSRQAESSAAHANRCTLTAKIHVPIDGWDGLPLIGQGQCCGCQTCGAEWGCQGGEEAADPDILGSHWGED